MPEPTISSRPSDPILPNPRPIPLGGQTRLGVTPDSGHVSLADVRPGDVVKIVEILFEMVRNHCWELGIVEGDVYECMRFDRDEIVLARPRGGQVAVERHCARFVVTDPRRTRERSASPPASLTRRRTGRREKHPVE